jgi:hypothetical protein
LTKATGSDFPADLGKSIEAKRGGGGVLWRIWIDDCGGGGGWRCGVAAVVMGVRRRLVAGGVVVVARHNG